MCGLSLEVTDLRVEPPSQHVVSSKPFLLRKKSRPGAPRAPLLRAAADAEALKRGASLEEVSRLHDELTRGAAAADGVAGRRRSTCRTGGTC